MGHVKFALFAGVVTLAGCASLERAANDLASPQFTQAAINVKNLVEAFDCGLVVTGAALAGNIAVIVDAGDAAIGTTGKVYAVSQAICIALGGIPSAMPVPVK